MEQRHKFRQPSSPKMRFCGNAGVPLTQQYFLSCFSQHNLRPKVRHQTKSYELVRSLVGAGEGYAIMIMRPVTNRAYNGTGLAYIPLADDVPPAQYGLAITNRAIPTKLKT